MNDVLISGLINGDIEQLREDAYTFSVMIPATNDRYESDTFELMVYGNTANFLNQRQPSSGDRIVAQGRLSREKYGEEYRTVISVSRVLSLGDSADGVDFSRIIVSGEVSRAPTLSTLKNGKSVLNLSIANKRHYTKPGSSEVHTYTTYLRATAWEDRALAIEGLGLTEGVNVTLDGSLKSSTYENKEGETVEQVDVWINEAFVSSPAVETSKPLGEGATRAPAKTRTAAPKRTKSVDDGLPF